MRTLTPDESKSLFARLWAKTKVDDVSGCWVWQGSSTQSGYGTLSVLGVLWIIPRLSLTLLGTGLRLGEFACHKCDNPPCWNPDHLFGGTPLENSEDMHAKGRARTTALLDDDQMREAVGMYKEGKLLGAIGKHFGVSFGAVDTAIQRYYREGYAAMARDERQDSRDRYFAKHGYD